MGKARMQVTIAGDDLFRQVNWGPFRLPSRYRARFDDPDWPFVAEVEVEVSKSGFAARSVTFTARPGGSLQGSELRLPISGMIRHSAPVMAMQELSGQPGKWQQLWTQEQVDGFYAHFRKHERAGGRAPITNERLREVAAIYKANERSGAPSKAVASALDLSQSYARNLVSQARRAGMLPPVKKGGR
jgi:hypothetical protein